MKCTNCGKNNASYHYRFTVNGDTSEMHLCPECAAKLEPDKEFSTRAGEMFRHFENSVHGFFDDGFFGGFGLPERGFINNGFFGGFPNMGFMPTMFMPVIGISVPGTGERTAPEQQETGREVDPELATERRKNELREKMKAAVEAENYEEAAKLRDELKKIA